jgi:N,N'-diacetyllegionaminate synthase
MTLPPEFAVGDRVVGPGRPCYVIAEAGANHNRDMGVARRLIEVAAEAGADAVKFQTYSGSTMYSRRTPPFKYLKTQQAPTDLLEDISLPRDWQPELARYARSLGLDWFSTPFDLQAVRELDELEVPVMKIASFELVDLPLIRAAAATGRPLILSTGMATMGEVEEALEAIAAAGGTAAGLMQCASLYPSPPELINLRAMGTMEQAFRVPVGLSDHTHGVAVSVGAAALGAAFVEKHYTLDRAMEGPDHPFAIEPDELRALVEGVRAVEAAMGDGRKAGPSPEEREEMYVLGRRSLIVTRDLPAGTVLERDMLTTKRPGWGIAPKHLDLVVGRPLKADVREDDVLTWDEV